MLACLTILTITGFLNAGHCAEYEMNTDRPGMDYSCYDLPVNDMTAGTSCKSDCDSDSKCIAWTYVKPNTTKGPHALCCKKNSLPAKKSDACCISGVKPCPPINITSPSTPDQTYFINQALPITWDTSKIKNYGTVFLSVVQYDIQHMGGWEGGGFPVANMTGSYQWTIPANVGPTSLSDTAFNAVFYSVKVATPDGRCVGQSVKFSIKKKLIPMRKMQQMNTSP